MWLPVLSALSTNSACWYGMGTGSASYRYQAWTRWPTTGASDILATALQDDRPVRLLLESECRSMTRWSTSTPGSRPVRGDRITWALFRPGAG
ncbi:glutamate-cysteine ligase family protein [Kocuria sp. CPCC 205258]|uniref:glutamate-cysteine ligase family protein n=1 Tax=Kocuria sp. CPCC 205258 TaxID=3073552 RepID=UPI0034D56A67